uniref:Uncharacterized protein n=1 Tax=Cannabis sativa TaxID=3483 RepID=A0A803PKS8_CANSA
VPIQSPSPRSLPGSSTQPFNSQWEFWVLGSLTNMYPDLGLILQSRIGVPKFRPGLGVLRGFHA